MFAAIVRVWETGFAGTAARVCGAEWRLKWTRRIPASIYNNFPRTNGPELQVQISGLGR
jgi:hypothetical protein